MAIEKNNFKVSRFDSEFSPSSKKSMSSDDDELPRRSSAVESDDDDDFDDADSGAGSDDFDLLELGDTGVEFCQLGNQTCSIPFELYDLSGLEEVLSVDVWNECLSEEERLALTRFLPDMDQETFMVTMKELFTGCNFHFGSPIKQLFDMFKGGLCEPRVALYREGLNFFQKRQHYHLLRKHQNNMVSNLCQIRDAWLNCRGYSIEEKLRVLHIMKSQKSLMYEKMEDLETDSSESSEGLRSRMIKDKKVAQKVNRSSAYGASSDLDFPLQGRLLALEPAKYGKQNPKGNIKFPGTNSSSPMNMVGHFPSIYNNLDINSGPHGSSINPARRNKLSVNDTAELLRMRDKMRYGEESEEMIHGVGTQRDRGIMRGSGISKFGAVNVAKKQELLRADRLVTDSFMSLSAKTDDVHSRNHKSKVFLEGNLFAAKTPHMKTSNDFAKKAKYSENAQQLTVEDQVQYIKGKASHVQLRGTPFDSTDGTEPFWRDKTQGEAFTMDSQFKSDNWKAKSKKLKALRQSPDITRKSYRSPSPQLTDRHVRSEFRTKLSQEKARGKFVNGGADVAMLRGNRMSIKGEETESDSSEQSDDDDDDDTNLFLRSKSAYPSGVEVSKSSLLKSGVDAKRSKNVTKVSAHTEHGPVSGVDCYSLTRKKRGQIRDGSLQDSSTRIYGEGYFSGLGKFSDADDAKLMNRMGLNSQSHEESGERLHTSSLKAYSAGGKKKGKVGLDRSVTRLKKSRDYVVDEDDSLEMQLVADDNCRSNFRKKVQSNEAYGSNRHENSDAPLLGCSSASKKRKGKEDLTDAYGRVEEGDLRSKVQQIEDSSSLKKSLKRKVETDTGSSEVEISEPLVTGTRTQDMELETKPQKKSFTLITPTVQTGFSFSIIHLLSAVRLAMMTPLSEDTLEIGIPVEKQNLQEGDVNGVSSREKTDVNNSEQHAEVGIPSLTVQEIINRVRSNPGDPCVLETQEPLQDLVRGVLKIFSSKTAPLGAKGWKVLAVYEKSAKSWSWIGPVSQTSSDRETIEEVISPEAWGLPYKMLVKLVDSFANWLKSGQETLQQIGSLPAPPLALMQFNLDEKERFRDLRAQKSLNTISPSSDEVRAYFRKEEVLRYSIPDRAFSYTAADGKKSIVAPLRRCGGKPTSKARDHFMLKRDRPPHVTILCLVRDAAARLPGSIGTRADVCTLLRDSQYIVEDVSDAQVNQVVSGALDRLHYERDPCVQFDGERKLWVYLHREREEEDFEDDGTSSTKKWKRQKKDPSEQPDQGVVTVAYHESAEQSGYDLFSDLNAEPSCIGDDKSACGDVGQNMEDNIDNNNGPEQGELGQGHPMIWDSLAINPMQENKLLCQENSTNQDFDDEAFGRERPVGLLSASLL